MDGAISRPGDRIACVFGPRRSLWDRTVPTYHCLRGDLDKSVMLQEGWFRLQDARGNNWLCVQTDTAVARGQKLSRYGDQNEPPGLLSRRATVV